MQQINDTKIIVLYSFLIYFLIDIYLINSTKKYLYKYIELRFSAVDSISQSIFEISLLCIKSIQL